jgi:hypothetical protein
MGMSEQQHTPGPWKVSEVEDGGEIISRGVKGPNGRGINTGCDIEMFSEADARLIAAAPELLEAARAAIVAIMIPTTVDRSEVVVRLGNAVAKADGTIAKAEGKTEHADAR